MARRKGNKAKTLNKQVAMAKKRGNKASSKAKQQLEQEGGGEQARGLGGQGRPCVTAEEFSGGRAALVLPRSSPRGAGGQGTRDHELFLARMVVFTSHLNSY